MNWDEVRRWRVEKRSELVACRRAVRPARKRLASTDIGERVREMIVEVTPPGAVIGGYWPIRGEINLAYLFRELDGKGYRVALPVVVEKNEPVEFWRWMPGMPMSKGIWDIPIPATRDPVKPEVLVVPLVGFDDQCFRLGNGGGYYDRTLAACDVKPYCIGVGYSFAQVSSIHPQAHDVPMDVIVTEEGVVGRESQLISIPRNGEAAGKFASSACSMAGLDPSYFGYMSAAESEQLVITLLRSVRVAAGLAMEIALFGKKSLEAATYLDLVYGDIYAGNLLRKTANRLKADEGNTPDETEATGTSIDDGVSTDVDLCRIHQEVAQTIRSALPKISEPQLYKDLTKVLRIQERALATIEEAWQSRVGGRMQVRNAV